MSGSVDVLAALQKIADGEGDIEMLALQARAAVAELIEAHKRIAALDPETDSASGFNEWGESECFGKAQEISRAAIARCGALP